MVAAGCLDGSNIEVAFGDFMLRSWIRDWRVKDGT